MKKIKVGFFSFLILVLLTEIALLSQAIFYPPTKPATANIAPTQTPTTQQTNTNDDSFNIPPLFPQLEWIKTNTTDPKSMQTELRNSMLYKNSSPVLISITGQEWVVAQKNQPSTNRDKIYEKFLAYYETELVKNGWSQQIEYNNSNLQTIQAGGPTGNIWGYLKLINGRFRIIILEQTIQYLGANTTNQPPSCPCNIEFRIFVSDAIPVSEINY